VIDLNKVKNVFAIQMMHSFVSGVVGVAIPLMMKARDVDVVTMGLVFAAMPLIFQIGRMAFAVVSDLLGRKPFFISNGVLGSLSCLIYYAAHTPLEFLFGKVAEATKEGTLWAVNRAYLLEEGGNWRLLTSLRTLVYFAFAGGSLAAGFLIVWFLFEGTMLFCAMLGVIVLLLAMFLPSERRKEFGIGKALGLLDFRRKTFLFKSFLFLFLLMGLSLGLIGGFVITIFLDSNGFGSEAIGLITAVQLLLAGGSCYVFSKTTKVKQLILVSGLLFSITYALLGFSTSAVAAALVIMTGGISGMMTVTQEGIMSKITDRQSYGTDIGLLWTGFHIGESVSLVITGFLIATWGFIAPFALTAASFPLFYVPAYLIMKRTSDNSHH
jgi:MFS family permease